MRQLSKVKIMTVQATRLYVVRAIVLALAAVALLGPSSTIAAGTSTCKMARIAELPLRPARVKLIVDGAINGHKIGIVLDTGATMTLIPRPVATRLGLNLQTAAYRIVIDGGEQNLESTLIDELKIGQSTIKSRRMMVAGRDVGGDIGLTLGEDFFREVDVEFDLANNAVRLFQSKDCDGVSLAYWATNGASEVAIEAVDADRPRILLTVEINGKPLRALLDSGADLSVLDKPEAERLGVAPGVAASDGTGISPESAYRRPAPLRRFVIGDEAITDTAIQLADLFQGVSYADTGSLYPGKIDGAATLLLGVDFLRAHRVLVAHSQRKLYFTYAGGPVFARTAPAKASADQVPAR